MSIPYLKHETGIKLHEVPHKLYIQKEDVTWRKIFISL